MATQAIFPSGLNSHENRTLFHYPVVQQYVKESFWPQSKSSIAEFASYFKYVQWTLSILSWPEGSIDSTLFAVKSYGDLDKIIQCIRSHANDSRLSIAERLRCDFPVSDQAQILRSMDLTVRLWLTLHLQSEDYPVGPRLSEFTEVRWNNEVSLKTMIREAFPTLSFAYASYEKNIDPSFTAQSLRKICGIKIQWTANLKDHLAYDRSTSTVRLFPHKICLISHLESNDILPKELVSETLRTIDLLFPFGKESTQRFLDESGQSFYRTSSRDLSRPTDFSQFRYWGKRLIELHDVYNEGPRNVVQMWNDRRNPMQWWTFWLAAAIVVLTIVFGTISSYTGFKQVALAEKTYQLSVLQACSQTDLSNICRT